MMTLVLAALACAAAPSAPIAESVWEDAYLLGDPAQHVAAGARLALAKRDGLEVLFRVARSAGDGATLAAATRGSHCLRTHLELARGSPYVFGLGSPAQEAAGLLVDRLAADEAARKEFRSSAEPMRRAFALIAEVGAPRALLADLQVLVDEKDPRVLAIAHALAVCSRSPGQPLSEAGSAIAKRLSTSSAGDCSGPGPEADSLRDEISSGVLKKWSWSSGSNDFFQLSVGAEDGRTVDLSPRCSLAVYDALAARGSHVAQLLLPMLRDAPASLPERKGAAERAARDLASFEERDRNDLAAALVNGGYHSPAPVDLSSSPSPEQLAAAARTGQADAPKAIWLAWECRDAVFVNANLALLGFLKTREASDAAAMMARDCPEAAPGAAAALLRAGDPRALPLLERALGQHAHAFELAPVLRERWSPALAAELKRIARSEGDAAEEARAVLESKAR